ncbi:hypothetical protein [Paenarthrobacter aromaticivorans]|uniref:Uncharacterized protein n=1 Tax=Paenarthrobacter aromaticivorans TaxID=2849150 RepID=A0ABS6I9U8_9MICC|nr:hypothetical protein [Paenarthrobacter sp. MMS21-TAE1-1]MBU8868498.1 hypothetical protein [Paenarthrobacter sp. MMS21-TAE1-1]
MMDAVQLVSPDREADRPISAFSPRIGLIEDWSILVGADADIRRNGVTVRRGRVESVTADGTMLWIEGDHTETRRLFDKAENREAWVTEDLTALFYEMRWPNNSWHTAVRSYGMRPVRSHPE